MSTALKGSNFVQPATSVWSQSLLLSNERMRQKTSFRDRIIYYWTHKEPSTGYSKKKADSGFSEQTQPRFYIVNPTGTHVHLLNGWQTGTREPRSFILPVEWKAMSLDPNRKDLRRDHAWRRCNQSQGEPLVSRAFAGSMWYTRSISGLSWRTPSPCLLLVVDHEARMCRSPGWEPPKRDLGTMASNSFQVKENDRSVYTSLNSCTRRKPSGGVSSPKPQTRQVTGQVSLVRLVRTMDTPSVAGVNFHPKFRYVTESPNKAGRGGWATRGVPCARFLVCPIINNTITKTRFLSHSFITGHTEPRQGTPRRRVFMLLLSIYNF